MKITVKSLSTLFVYGLLMPMRLWAQTADQIVEDGADFLIQSLGPAIFLVGIVITGISLSAGSRNGVQRGIYTVIGGIIILAARAVFNTISQFAN